jgi:DNA-binding NarL/FixJ family response regulator
MRNPLVLIADDHVIIRRGLKFLFDSHFNKYPVFETASTKGVQELMTQHPFTHLILDMQMQDGNVMEIISDLKEKYPDAKILIYTMSSEEVFGKRMLHLGVDGFLSKQESEEEVIHAIDYFLRGKKYISQHLQSLINEQPHSAKNPIEQLSEKEMIVLTYLVKGAGVKEIAEQLSLKPNTVATFKARIFDKMGVSNLIDLRNIAILYGLRTS